MILVSYFRPNIDRMAGYQPGEQPREGEFIKLNTNENPYPPSPRVMEAIRQAAGDGLRKYPDPLATVFRAQAAKLHGVGPDWILAGNGSDDLLTIVTRSFVGAGDCVVAPTPSYILYRSLAEIQAARYEEVPFDASWDLPDDFAQRHARLAFLPNPNSPSGTMVTVQRVRELTRSLQSHSPLIVDEAYVDFADENCAGLVRECDNVIVTRSLSKSYSLAGIRFGYCLAQPHIIAGLVKVKDSYNCDEISIAAAGAALEDQEHFRRNIDRVRATRTRLTQSVRQLGFHVPDSQANFVWCTNGPAPARRLYEQLKERRILVRYMNYPGYGDGLRISVGTDGEIDRLIDELKPLL
ncbi:MAG: histidinol-phosphate transaminase [Planctomycetes bacterium]|nr:histidinol-phosphate transaminase [Planctomycetota bacterium]